MKRRRIFWLIPLFAVITVALVGLFINDDDDNTDESARATLDLVSMVTHNRTFWDSHNISNYQMAVHMFAPPVLPIGVDLTIENGRITDTSIIACDNPTDWHHEDLCEPTRTYYSEWGKYTIIELFAEAERCLRKTETMLNSCTAFDINGFDGFSTLDEMQSAANLCEAEMETNDSLCLVQFHSDYGYPYRISATSRPNLDDGGSDILVQDFQRID